MKFKSILLASFYYSTQFAVGPFIFHEINERAGLPIFSAEWLNGAGFVFLFLGTFIIAYCFYLFRILGSGTPAPIEPPRKIVFESVYKYTRNPMYIGYILVLFGEFFLFGSLLVLFYATMSILGFHLLVTLWEEKILLRRFGSEYLEYCQRVPRWL